MRNRIPTSDYHGAYKPTVDADPVDRWTGNGVIAFAHDLMSSVALPPEYGICDVLVADLPWANGFDTFNARAGIADGRTYRQFMDRISQIIEATDTTAYLVTGKHAKARLPKADAELPTRLNEDPAVVYAYRPGPEADARYGVTQELLVALARTYDVAGDFCCGYGRTVRTFLRQGKRAVASDMNPTCIGYIAEHAPDWAVR